MNRDTTDKTDGSRSFGERVFARFDSMDDRFDRIEARIEKLEIKQYDTKPIWEQALAAIAETNAVMAAGFDTLRAEGATTNARMDGGFDTLRAEGATTNARMDAGFDALRAEIATTNARMDGGFDQIRKDFDFAWRGIERKIDVLNHNILDLKAEQRYVDSRLEKLESQPKPS